MNHRLQSLAAPLFLTLLFGGALATALAGPRPRSVSSPGSPRLGAPPAIAPAPDRARVAAAYGKLPLAFEVNRGQANGRARFLSRGPGYTLALAPTEALLSLPSAKRKPKSVKKAGLSSVGRRGAFGALRPNTQPPAPNTLIRMKLVDANPAAEIAGDEPLPGKSNYFIGNDPKKWRTNVPQYARVRCRNVYPGIDLVYYGNQRQLEYDFVVAPGGDPAAIRLAFDGASRISVGSNGDLVLRTDAGEVRQHKPQIYQEIDGVRHPVAGGYALSRTHTAVPPYRSALPSAITTARGRWSSIRSWSTQPTWAAVRLRGPSAFLWMRQAAPTWSE